MYTKLSGVHPWQKVCLFRLMLYTACRCKRVHAASCFRTRSKVIYALMQKVCLFRLMLYTARRRKRVHTASCFRPRSKVIYALIREKCLITSVDDNKTVCAY